MTPSAPPDADAAVGCTSPSYSNGAASLALLGDTIGANLAPTTARVKDHEALVQCTKGRRWTYPHIAEDIDTVALGPHALDTFPLTVTGEVRRVEE